MAPVAVAAAVAVAVAALTVAFIPAMIAVSIRLAARGDPANDHPLEDGSPVAVPAGEAKFPEDPGAAAFHGDPAAGTGLCADGGKNSKTKDCGDKKAKLFHGVRYANCYLGGNLTTGFVVVVSPGLSVPHSRTGAPLNLFIAWQNIF